MTDHILTALAALSAITDARRWLAEAPAVEAQPGRRRTPTTPRDLSNRAAVAVDRLLRTERAERRIQDIPTTPHPVPVRAGLLDAAELVDAAVTDSAWLTASALHRRPLVVVMATAYAAWEDLWAAAVLQLRIGLPWLVCACRSAPRSHRADCPDRTAREVAELLTTADARARIALGMGPSWVSLAVACDDCRRRTVEAEVSSTNERDWIARCRNGCWIRPVEDDPRARLADSAVLRSIRRQYAQQRKRERIAA